MCTDKSHIYLFIDEEHNSYNTIVVTFDVKYISVIAYIVGGVECLLDIGKEIGLGDSYKTCFKDSLTVTEIQENTFKASVSIDGLPSFSFGKFTTSGYDPSWEWSTVKTMLSQGLK